MNKSTFTSYSLNILIINRYIPKSRFMFCVYYKCAVRWKMILQNTIIIFLVNKYFSKILLIFKDNKLVLL